MAAAIVPCIEDVSVQSSRWKSLAFALAGCSFLSAAGVLADDEGKRRRRDHEVAREALTNGEIRPLEAVVAEVRRTVPGDIVGIELEKYSGQWVYKIKVITPSGAMQRVNIDARGSGTPASGAAPPSPLAPATAPPTATEPRSR